MIQTKVAIVGAGPAGSICAIMLQRAGIDCLLIDRATFPRDKLCGGGLTPRAWQSLQEILPDFQYEYLEVWTIRACFDGEVKGDFRLNKPIRVVQREVFDNLLVKEYLRLGGKMIKETLGTVEEQADALVLNMRSGTQVECQHLVGADGANSQARRFLQPDFHADILCLEQYEPRDEASEPVITLEMSPQFNHGYYYEFPNRSFVAVGYGDHSTSMEQYKALIKAHGYPERKVRGAMITISQDYPHHDRVTLIGDAGGWVDNVSSEGLYYAIATGRNAAEAIRTGKSFEELNREVARKKRHKVLEDRIIYGRLGVWMMRWVMGQKRLCKKLLFRYFGW